MKKTFLGSAMIVLAASSAAADHHAEDYAVAAAKLALPTAFQDSATVVSVAADGTETVVREGTSSLTCSVSSRDDDNATNRLAVWCVPGPMRAVMDRARELRESGASREDGMAQLRSEVESGAVGGSSFPAVGYAFRGAADTYGKDVTEIEGESWQLIGVPFATGESIGVIEEPEGSMPWIMASGTPFAHIMVSGATDEEFE